jgi:type I restriction enzyme, R subunit
MLRIFDEQIKQLVDGRAKAMIVATSRVGGLLYYETIKQKLKERGANYDVLYAFSDFVHPETNKTYSEHELNELDSGELIEERFEQDKYRLMIVASKFQTGFDQPLLAGMFLDKPVADRNAVQTVSRLNRCHDDKDKVIVVDFTNNARAILKAFNKYRHGSPHEPDEPDPQQCLDLYDEIISQDVFVQSDASPLVSCVKTGDDAAAQTLVARLRVQFQGSLDAGEDRKAYVHLLARFVKSFHFLKSFFTFEDSIREFAAFCEYLGPQLIKAGSISDLMKQVRATIVEKAAVIDQGVVDMPAGTIKPKPRKGKGGGGAPPQKVSVLEMIERIKQQFNISEEEALYIKEVSQEKMGDESIRQTIASHKNDLGFLNSVYKGQVNGQIQDAYALRELFESLGDPKYTDTGAIFDLMAHAVVQHGVEIAGAA